jgi:hypothetical protein
LQMVALCARILLYERILPSRGVRPLQSKPPQELSIKKAANLVPTVQQEPTPVVSMAKVPGATQGQSEEAVAELTVESTMKPDQAVAVVPERTPIGQKAVVTKMRALARQCEHTGAHATGLESASGPEPGAVAETAQALTTQPEQVKAAEALREPPVQQAAAAKARVCERRAAAVLAQKPMNRQGNNIAAGVAPTPAIQQRPVDRDAGQRQRNQTATMSPTIAPKASSEVRGNHRKRPPSPPAGQPGPKQRVLGDFFATLPARPSGRLLSSDMTPGVCSLQLELTVPAASGCRTTPPTQSVKEAEVTACSTGPCAAPETRPVQSPSPEMGTSGPARLNPVVRDASRRILLTPAIPGATPWKPGTMGLYPLPKGAQVGG